MTRQVKGGKHEARTIVEERMVARLGPAMIHKLARAREKGRGGWELPGECSITHLHDLLADHIWKHNLDMVDVANLAGMIWWRLEFVPGDREVLEAHVAQHQRTPRFLTGSRVRTTGPDINGELEFVVSRPAVVEGYDAEIDAYGIAFTDEGFQPKTAYMPASSLEARG